MSVPESRLDQAVREFAQLPFEVVLEALGRREDILLGEIAPHASESDKIAIRAAPIQILGSAPARQVEVAVVLVEGEREIKRYLYFGEDNAIEAPPDIVVSPLNWRD